MTTHKIRPQTQTLITSHVWLLESQEQHYKYVHCNHMRKFKHLHLTTLTSLKSLFNPFFLSHPPNFTRDKILFRVLQLNNFISSTSPPTYESFMSDVNSLRSSININNKAFNWGSCFILKLNWGWINNGSPGWRYKMWVGWLEKREKKIINSIFIVIQHAYIVTYTGNDTTRPATLV